MSAEYSSKFQARMNELFRKAQDEDPKLTKGQYASKIGTTLNSLRGWLRGSGQPDADGLARIAAAENVSVDWLVGKATSPVHKKLGHEKEQLISRIADADLETFDKMVQFMNYLEYEKKAKDMTGGEKESSN
ncbi:helix-turn-helix domain-containing protein [Propionispora hippei]|uniref:HTH cro/C1-type domain-containing protein n=1 Tax=Propionispora hippei DSM 15287 TaxID=1123003 RepID=A0A1M6HR61_9FIRM|nr:helix-turn-helix transcriptional regulator [Propionispora hippei]SHJ24647.1 hypothetical protein SAMN02745170_02071 [Propionispora hippei DSM 15287]